jgi:voltage-dependent calcium channel L type alpha-1D
MIRWAESSLFGFIILFTIFLNTITLAIADPLDLPDLIPNSPTRDIFELLGMTFNIVFFIEAFSKIIAYGFYGGKTAYLSSAWNIMDFFIVVMSIFDFIPGMSGGNFSAIRSFRVLRPLRTITKFPELRFLVSLLLSCIPMLANVFGLNFFIYFVFGILGMQLFGGALRGRCYSMTDGAIMEDPFSWPFICGEGQLTCPKGFTCLKLGENPLHGMVTLDDIYHGLIVIFQIMTQEGWVDVMYMFQDSVSFFAFIYFFVLIFVGPIFAIQLFLVVITNKFNESKQAQELAASVSMAKTKEKPKKPLSQKLKSAVRSLIRSIKRAVRRKKIHDSNQHQRHHHHHHPESPSVFVVCAALPPVAAILSGMGWIRSKLLRVAEGKTLSNFIVGCIMFNTLLMAIDHACDFKTMPYCYTFKGSLEAFNVAFCFIFLMEMIIKTGGFGLARYFSDVYNLFDFFIVVISLVEIYSVTTTAICLLSSSDGEQATLCDSGGSGLSVLRTFRLLRLIKLLKSFPNLQTQLAVAGKTLGSTSWLFLLVFIFLVIFTILGMSQFAGAIIDDPEALIMGSSVLVYWNEDIASGPTRLWPGIVTNLSTVTYPYHYFVAYKFPHVGRNSTVGEWMYCPSLCPADHEELCMQPPFIRGAVPRGNWDGFFVGFITTFEMVTQDNWNTIMYASTRYSSTLAAVYFILLIIIGNFILFNLLIAIIIQGFADTKAQKESAGPATSASPTASPLSSARESARVRSEDSPQTSPSKPSPKVLLWVSDKVSAAREGFYALPPVAAVVEFNTNRSEHTFWVIPPDSPSRKFCAAIATNDWFETVILIAILLSSAQLAVSRPAMGVAEADFFENMGLFMNALFLLEAILKVVSLGGMQYVFASHLRAALFRIIDAIVGTCHLPGTSSMAS